MLTVDALSEASSSTNVTYTQSRSRAIIRCITSVPRNSASSSVVEVKLSFMITTLRPVARARMAWIRVSSSSSLPRRVARSSSRSKWVKIWSGRNSRALRPGTGYPRLAR